MEGRRNRNRGYQQLRVWQDAIGLYRDTCAVFRRFPYELKRVASQQLASVDSVHRNIAEGYCRRSINEYIQHLYIALGSLGESVSGLVACRSADQVSADISASLDEKSYKLENGLLRLVESLEKKRKQGTWTDSLMIKETNESYGLGLSDSAFLQNPSTPTLRYSNTPVSQGENT